MCIIHRLSVDVSRTCLGERCEVLTTRCDCGGSVVSFTTTTTTTNNINIAIITPTGPAICCFTSSAVITSTCVAQLSAVRLEVLHTDSPPPQVTQHQCFFPPTICVSCVIVGPVPLCDSTIGPVMDPAHNPLSGLRPIAVQEPLPTLTSSLAY